MASPARHRLLRLCLICGLLAAGLGFAGYVAYSCVTWIPREAPSCGWISDDIRRLMD